MENIFLIAGIVSVIFFLAKFIEMRFVEDEPKPLKYLIRDSLLVYISVVVSGFLYDQLYPIIQEGDTTPIPLAFTDNPPF